MYSVDELEDRLIDLAFAEDIGDGDHTTLCCIPEEAMGKSHLLIKEDGILAGVEVAKRVFARFDPTMKVEVLMGDGTPVKKGDIAMVVTGKVRSLLQTERLMLNIMQRMSGIATMTNRYVKRLEGTKTHVLDTRKTTPGMRMLEKQAVKIGGGMNHRIGLFDMILLKDNHVDFAGGIKNAITRCHEYLKEKNLDLKIELEVRNFDELNQALEQGGINRVMLDNFSVEDTAKAVKAYLLADTPEDAMHSRLPQGRGMPHIAIPATAGTGSEATETAVMYVDGQKLSLCHPALLPEGVVLDASLLATLPEYHKKACALDALCQGIESYWARGATEDSQVDAFLAITGVLDNLRAYLAGDEAAAAGMLEAAYRSGKAIQVSRTTAAHAMSYQITKRLGLAHGHACMLTLPILWVDMLQHEDALPVVMDLAQKMRLGSEYMAPRLLAGMLIDLGLEPEVMPDEALLDALADSVNTQRLSNHPMPLTRDELKSVYRRAFTRRAGADRQVCIDLWQYYGQ